MRRKRKKQGRRLRPLWGALAAMSFLLTLGAAGGMEHGTMALGQGAWLMAASLGAGAAFAKLAGLPWAPLQARQRCSPRSSALRRC